MHQRRSSQTSHLATDAFCTPIGMLPGRIQRRPVLRTPPSPAVENPAVRSVDNLKAAVKKILRGQRREETARFIAAEHLTETCTRTVWVLCAGQVHFSALDAPSGQQSERLFIAPA